MRERLGVREVECGRRQCVCVKVEENEKRDKVMREGRVTCGRVERV